MKESNMTDHFTFFASYYDSVENLDSQTKGEFFDALFKYALRGESPKDSVSPIVHALFTLAKPNIDRSIAKQKAGQAGGKQSSSRKQAESKQTESKQESEAKQGSSDKEKDKEKEKEIGNRNIEIPKGINVSAFDEWVKYKGSKLSKQSRTLALNFLCKYDYDTQYEIVSTSIMNGWKGLFEPKQKSQVINHQKPSMGDKVDEVMKKYYGSQSFIDGEIA